MDENKRGGREGRRSRVTGGYPYRRRVALTEENGRAVMLRAVLAGLSDGAYLARVVEQHLAAERDPLPPAARVTVRDLVVALDRLGGELRGLLREARGEGVLFNQLARHLNTTAHQAADSPLPADLVALWSRTLARHARTTVEVDAALRRVDQATARAAIVVSARGPNGSAR